MISMRSITCELNQEAKPEEGVFHLLKELKLERPSVFIFRMNSNCLESKGIYASDLLVVDRHISITDASFVLIESNGKLVVRSLSGPQLKKIEGSSSEDIDEENPQIWGVVTFVIHSLFSGGISKKRITVP